MNLSEWSARCILRVWVGVVQLEIDERVRGVRYQADTTWSAAHKKEAELWALFVALVNLFAPAVIYTVYFGVVQAEKLDRLLASAFFR